MEEEIEIDFGRLFSRMWAKKKIIIPIILVCTIIAAIVSLMLPKEYTSTATVQTQSAGKVDISGAAAAILGMRGGGASSPTLNYIELMKIRRSRSRCIRFSRSAVAFFSRSTALSYRLTSRLYFLVYSSWDCWVVAFSLMH